MLMPSTEFYLEHPSSALPEHLPPAGAGDLSQHFSRLRRSLDLCQQWRCWTHMNWIEAGSWVLHSLPSVFGVKLLHWKKNSWLSPICTFSIMFFVDLPWFEFVFHSYCGLQPTSHRLSELFLCWTHFCLIIQGCPWCDPDEKYVGGL